jgi:hypothetical protein
MLYPVMDVPVVGFAHFKVSESPPVLAADVP